MPLHSTPKTHPQLVLNNPSACCGRLPFSSVEDVAKLRFQPDENGRRLPYVDLRWPAQPILEAYRVSRHGLFAFMDGFDDDAEKVYLVPVDNDDEQVGPLGPVGDCVELRFVVDSPDAEDAVPDGVLSALRIEGGDGKLWADAYTDYWQARLRELRALTKEQEAQEAQGAADMSAATVVEQATNGMAEVVGDEIANDLNAALHEVSKAGHDVGGALTVKEAVTLSETFDGRLIEAADMSAPSLTATLLTAHEAGTLSLEACAERLQAVLRHSGLDPESRLTAVVFEELSEDRWRLGLYCREPAALGRSATAHNVVITPRMGGTYRFRVTGRRKYPHQVEQLQFIEATLGTCLARPMPNEVTV